MPSGWSVARIDFPGRTVRPGGSKRDGASTHAIDYRWNSWSQGGGTDGCREDGCAHGSPSRHGSYYCDRPQPHCRKEGCADIQEESAREQKKAFPPTPTTVNGRAVGRGTCHRTSQSTIAQLQAIIADLLWEMFRKTIGRSRRSESQFHV
jgi:hypothetical protein